MADAPDRSAARPDHIRSATVGVVGKGDHVAGGPDHMRTAAVGVLAVADHTATESDHIRSGAAGVLGAGPHMQTDPYRVATYSCHTGDTANRSPFTATRPWNITFTERGRTNW